MNYSIGVVIHSHNSGQDIGDCIESAKILSKTITVIDMESNDNTALLAKKHGGVVYSYRYTRYVEPSRNFGMEKSPGDWVFILDTDERMTPELSEEIRHTIQSTEYSSFKVPRKNIFSRVKWLKHGGWWPDYQIRLINKKYFVSWPKEIHSTPHIKGKQGYLNSAFIHYFHRDIAAMVDKTLTFEDLESDLLYRVKKQVSIFTFFRKFVAESYRRLLRDLGFLDGPIGIIEGVYQAFSKTITYLYLYEKNHASHDKKSGVL